MAAFRRTRTASLTVAAVAVLASCGGESNETTANMSELSSCLSQALPAYEVTPGQSGADLIAQDAGVGSVQLLDTRQEIQVVAEESVAAADSVRSSYEAFGVGEVDQHGTVVVAATLELSDEERTAVEGCLDDQGVG